MCYLIKQKPVAESSDSSSQELLISNTARSRRLGDVGKSKFRCLGAEGLMLSRSQRSPAAQGEKGGKEEVVVGLAAGRERARDQLAAARGWKAATAGLGSVSLPCSQPAEQAALPQGLPLQQSCALGMP